MRNVIIVFAAVIVGAVLVLVGSAIGSSPASAAAPTSYSTPAPVATPEPAPAPVAPTTSGLVGDSDGLALGLIHSPQASQLVSTVRSQLRYWSYGGTDLSYVSLGVSICQALDRGASYSQLLTTGPPAGFTSDETIAIVNSSINVLCPIYAGTHV